jgi:hypothetical protein
MEQTRERAVPTFVVLRSAGGPSWNVIEDDPPR